MLEMSDMETLEQRIEYLEAWVEISKEQMHTTSQSHFEALVRLRVERNRELKEKRLRIESPDSY